MFCGGLPCFAPQESDLKIADATDDDATTLSHVGMAVYETLRKKHAWHHNSLWNVTSGKMIGDLQHTPGNGVFRTADADPKDGHSDWFPEKICEVMSKTEHFCDVLSLAPPDGVFIDAIQKALKTIDENARQLDPTTKMAKRPVIVRMMFGNLPAMPVNCDAVIKKLTEVLSKDLTNVQVWVGAWRIGSSWNHAKFVAVDGKYLHTGGHNMWDGHYLRKKPVHDLSFELTGEITYDAHVFANEHWAFIKKKQDTFIGQIAEKIPDYLPLAWKTRVIVSEWPSGVATEFPPQFKKNLVPYYEPIEKSIPLIGMGRLGSLQGAHHPILYKDRPSDDAFIAMIDSAKEIIRMTLQDLGPVCIPSTKVPLPGLKWPKPYLNALARVIWTKGVDVEIILSNPGSIPNNLGMTEACYGNGWSCVDVSAEIIKRIKKQFGDVDEVELRKKVADNLRVCFIKHGTSHKSTYADGTNIGLHSKHFYIDDICAYVGSQNLYVCDLAEWGVVVDDKTSVEKMLKDHWNPMWKASFTGKDVDVQEVMDSLDIDRDGEEMDNMSERTKLLLAGKKYSATAQMPSKNNGFYGEGTVNNDRNIDDDEEKKDDRDEIEGVE